MTGYRPVSCEIHSQYELLVMQRTDIRLNYLDQGGKRQCAAGIAVDLYTREGEEFIVMQTNPETALTIRLDRIIDYSHT